MQPFDFLTAADASSGDTSGENRRFGHTDWYRHAPAVSA